MIRRAHLIAVVLAFVIGCAVFLMAGALGVQAQASKKEEARCQGTRTITPKNDWPVVTNDLPDCPKGGLLLGTEGSDQSRSPDPARPSLDGGDGDDVIRGLGGNDKIFPGSGDDVVYGGDGDDAVGYQTGNDVVYGGAGNDNIDSSDDGGDQIYCGAGRDKYWADTDKNDYVDSSCETNSAAGPHQTGYTGHDNITSSASASPVPVPSSGGTAILPLAAALLVGSCILTYAILRRR